MRKQDVETACDSGESQRCEPHGATETRYAAETGPMRLCVPCARRWDEVTCEHDEPKDECTTCAEAAYEDALSAFYGGGGIRPIDEQCGEAWQQKRGLR